MLAARSVKICSNGIYSEDEQTAGERGGYRGYWSELNGSSYHSTKSKMHWVSEEGEQQRKKLQDLRYVIKAHREWRVGCDRCNLLCIVKRGKKMSPDGIHTQFSIEVLETKGSIRNGNFEVPNMQSGA